MPRAAFPLRLTLFLALGMAYLVFANFSYQRELPVLCPFRRMTGIRCPLCGFTTATSHLLHGDLRKSLRAHPLAPITLVAAIAWYVRSAVASAHHLRAVRGR